MAYTSSALNCLVPSFTNGASESSVWTYQSTDAASDVDASGYITDGRKRGMKVDDLVYVFDTDASPVIVTVHRVVSVGTGTDYSVDLSNGDTLVTGTDSD